MPQTAIKKRGAVSAVAILITAGGLVLSACSSSPSASADPGKKSWNIIMIPGVSGNEGYDSVVCGAKEVAKQKGVNLSVQAANTFSPTAETPILQAAIAKHPDAILIAPTDAQAMEGPIHQAVAQG